MLLQTSRTLTNRVAKGIIFSFSLFLTSVAMAKQPSPLKDIDCLATVIHYEANSEHYAGQLAVAKVVHNRAKERSLPICKVILEPGQFSGMSSTKIKQFSSKKDEHYIMAKQIAIMSFDESVDPSRGATFFRKKTMSTPTNMIVVVTHGNHKFLKERTMQ